MNKKISIIFIMILCSLLCLTPTLTYASSYATKITLKGVDRAPRLSMDTSSNKNLVLKLVENGSISSVKLEKIENDKSTVLLNKDSKNNKKAKGITISSDLKEIKIAKSLLKTDSYTKFKITAYDKNSIDNNKLIAYFNVKMLKTKDAEKGWYSVNNSPRLSYSAGFTITVTDYSKVKSLTVKDMNNNNSKISVGNPLSGSTEYVKNYKIDLSKLKTKNDMYFLQLTVVDNGGMKRVEEIIVKTEKTKVKVEDNSSKNTTNTNTTTSTTNSTTSQTTTTTSANTQTTNNNNTNTSTNTTTTNNTDNSQELINSPKNLSFKNVTFKQVASYNTNAQYNYVQATDYANGYYYVTTYNYLSNKQKASSILKFDSNFKLVKNTGNILSGNKLTGLTVSNDKNKLFVSYSKQNYVRVYDANTLKYVTTKKIANINSGTNGMSYDEVNQRYVIQAKNLKYYYIIDNNGKILKKISRQSGDCGQDICICGDYIIELMFKSSTVKIYSISKGKYLRTETINYSGNYTFGSNFEPEGICQISDNEFVITVAHSVSNKMRVLFFKGTIN